MRQACPRAALPLLRLDAYARRVGGQAEGRLLGLLRGEVDDARERVAGVLRVATHHAVINTDALRAQHLREPVERDPEPELLHQDVGDQRRREEPALEQLLRHRRRDDHGARLPTVLVDLVFDLAPFGVDSLVLHAGDDYPDRAAASIRVPAALLEADRLRLVGHRGVGDLDPLLGHVLVAEITATTSVWTRTATAGGRGVFRDFLDRIGVRIERGVGLRLLRHGVEFLLRLGELDGELREVDPLGLGLEDPPAKQLEMLLQLLVGAAKLVPLLRDLREGGLQELDFAA